MQSHSGSGDNVNGPKYEYYFNSPTEIQLKLEDIIKRKNEYCKSASGEYVCLPIIENEKTLDIEKIYVTIVLTHDNLSREKVFVDTSGISFENLIESVDMQRDLGSPQRMEASDTISLRNILLYKKVVILGDPGIGKSTLLKKLFIDICKKKCFPDFLPVYIPLSNLEISDINFINNYILQKYKKLNGVFEYFIENGHTFFLLDGLDEIDYREQQLVSSVIDHLVSIGNKVFLTCRTTVFPRGLFSSDFKIFECIGFNTAQRRKFLRLWFDDDLNLATLIENEIVNNMGTASISRNPLLLSLVAMHFDNNKNFKLPKKRISIYLKSIQLLLERREKKNIWKIPIDTRVSLLEYIAYSMNMKNVDVINEEMLRESIAVWKNYNKDSILNQYGVDIIIKLLTEVDGILYCCSKNQMRFLHLVLQESLTASYLSKQENWFEIFRSKMYFPRWEETLRLVISLVTKDNLESDKIADYLYDEIHINKDNLFLIGRYISDFDSANAKKFFLIFNDILEYILKDCYQYNFLDAIVALASICNSHTTYRDYLINYFNNELKKSYKVLFTYIRLLKLIPSKASRREAIRLINLFSAGHFKRDTAVYVIGMLINSLDYYYNFDFWKDIFQKYVNDSNSHLAGIIAISLSNIQMIEMYEFLEEERRTGNKYRNSLISYIIQKYEDENFTKHLVITAIMQHDIYLEQTFSDKYLQVESDDVLELIKQEKDEVSLAVLLDSNFSFVKKKDSEFLENIIFDENRSLILKCSALNTYLSENSNNKKGIDKIITFLKQNKMDTNLQLVCINSLTKQENTLLSDYFFECGTKLEQRVIYSLTRILSIVSIEGASLWLQEVLDEFEVGSPIHMYATLALAKQGYPGIYSYLKNYIIKFPYVNFREKVLIIKALFVSNANNRIKLLIELIKSESDIGIISLIVEKMGYIKEKEIEEVLLQYLDVKNWPSSWPKPILKLKEGEQKPTDRRMIMIILSLNKLGSHKAIPILEGIYNDVKQADDVRQTAYMAYRNLKWSSDVSGV